MSSLRLNAYLNHVSSWTATSVQDARAVADSLIGIQEEMICFRFEILCEWNKEKNYSM